MNPVEPFGTPVATWALVVSILSFITALTALGWQVAKHFLDGGRVRVYLNTAVLVPGRKIMVNRSGRHAVDPLHAGTLAVLGDGIELAQIVVENPGKVPVTIYSPSITFRTRRKNYQISTILLATDTSFGPDQATTDRIVRLEPYERVTFLLDYWQQMPDAMQVAHRNTIFLRGQIRIAGHAERTQKSSRRLQWKISRGAYTAITGSPDFTPFAAIWRELYIFYYGNIDSYWEIEKPEGWPPSSNTLRLILDEAMSKFESLPELEEFGQSLKEAAIKYGVRHPKARLDAYRARNSVTQMKGNLKEWRYGLHHWPIKETAETQNDDSQT